MIGLYIIAKDEYESAYELVESANGYVDATYITVTKKSALKRFQKLEKEFLNVKVSYFEWIDRFDAARNFNFSQGNEEFKLWIDCGDRFDFSEVPSMVALMEREAIDALWLPYEYAYDEQGNVIALHWRERIIRTSKDFTWRGWVHENLLTEQQIKMERLDVPVRHAKTNEKRSTERNLKILQEAYEATADPRYIHYLGITQFSMGNYQAAIDILKEYVTVGGWDEEIYRSLLRMADCAQQLDRPDEAMEYATKATLLLPEYPDAYYTIAQICFAEDQWKPTLEWLKVAFSKTRPESASITDPTIEDKARLIGAFSEFQMKNYGDALKLIRTVKTIPTHDLLPDFEYQASVDNVAAVLPALIKHYDEPSELWHNLKDDLKYDGRFRKLREMVTEPKTWPKKSIVFFCGQGYEEWGPHTLDKGMGGSEEAIVYLTRALAELGHDVHVYGETGRPPFLDHWVREGDEHSDEPMTPEGGMVTWYPWQQIDKRDQFDTLVVWRQPSYATQFKANKLFVDMHDLLPKKMVKPYKGVTYLFKSQFHKDQYPDIENFKIIPNGVKLEQFNEGN